MNRILLIALATASLLLVPTSAADGPGPSGLPVPLPGYGQGPSEDANAGGNSSAGNGSPPDERGDDGASGNETVQANAAAFRKSCRLIGWDGGEIEPRLNPILGVIVLDPDGCGYGIVDQFPPR